MPTEPAEPVVSEEDNELSPVREPGFVLTNGDITIFKLLYEFRFLRRDHISALTSRPSRRVHRRLLMLINRGYLTVRRPPQQKHIYALGKAAMPILVEQGIADPGIVTDRIRVHELKELFLKHELMIVDIHTVFALATESAPELQLVKWQEGRGLYDSVRVTDDRGAHTLPIRPDAYFMIVDARRHAGANTAHFFLEADRSTATQTRFQEKIIAYWEYLKQGRHATKYNIKSFRVITVTLTEKRAENLCALAVAVLPEAARKYFYFTSVEHFSIEHPSPILDRVYLSPRAPGFRYPLIPPPGTSQPVPSVV